MCYISLSLPFCFLLLCLSSSMLLCSFHTTYCSTVSFPGNAAPYFPQSLFLCSCILYILQRSPLSWVLFIPPYISLLLLEVAPPLCSFTFSHTSRGGAASSLFFSFFFGHSHFLCPFSSHSKHLVSSLTTSCLLTSLTPHYITLLFNTSNLLPATFFFCSSLLLQFQARYLNLLHHLHNFLFFPSNSVLNLVRACLWLSILLISWLYTSKDIVCCT